MAGYFVQPARYAMKATAKPPTIVAARPVAAAATPNTARPRTLLAGKPGSVAYASRERYDSGDTTSEGTFPRLRILKLALEDAGGLRAAAEDRVRVEHRHVVEDGCPRLSRGLSR